MLPHDLGAPLLIEGFPIVRAATMVWDIST